VDGVTLWHTDLVDFATGDQAGLLVFGQLRDATFVALLEAERRRDEGVDVEDGLLDGVLAGTDGDEVGVVVLTGELGRRNTPDQCGARAENLVGRDLLAVARSAEDDAQRFNTGSLVANHGARGVDAEARVVVIRVVGLRTVVNDLVTRIGQMLLQVFAELKTSMIRSDMDAHVPSLEVGCDTIARVHRAGSTSRTRAKIILSADAGWLPLAHHGSVQPVVETAPVPLSVTHAPPPSLSTRAVVLVVLAIAALVGQLTPIGERVLPESLSSMANSSGSWAMIVLACVYFSRLTGWRAAVLAMTSFVLMDLCFYAVFGLLGGSYPRHYVLFWVIVAVVIGPLVGLCATWLRSSHPRLQEVGVAAPSAILVGEGVFMLVRLPGVSVPYSVASIVVGVALFAVLAAWFLRRPTRIMLSLVTSVVAGAAFFEIYSLLPLVLDKVVP
jgi:Family of unknown function (DUF6518)